MSDIKRNHTFCKHDPVKINNQRIRSIYYGMIDRCYNIKRKDYRFYGGKGIKICDEWFNNPESFEERCLYNGYKDNLSIDRIQSNEMYCPENCRWISPEENSRDKISTRYISVNGFTLSGRQWADKLNVSTNFINTYFRNNGKEATVEYIKNRLE